MSEQLGLFGDPESAEPSHPVGPATVAADLLEVAAHLPPDIYLGTSSWNFPGWATLVYDRVAEERMLAREGLAAYSQHPLLRCVGIDRTFYGPISAAEFRRYAEQVPAEFRFVIKAPMLCTATTMRGEPGTRATSNPRFLDAGFASEQFVGPCLDGLGDHVGALVFQFPPVGRIFSQRPRGTAGTVWATSLREKASIPTRRRPSPKPSPPNRETPFIFSAWPLPMRPWVGTTSARPPSAGPRR